MKKILQYLFEHKTLSREQAKEILTNISKSMYSEHEVTAFITVFLMRSITIEELQGFRDALLDLCVKVDLNGHKTMDIVGTGGDGKNTFNISHFPVLLLRAPDKKLQSMANYGASSVSGASNVMNYLVINSKVITNN
jgi:anthranilate phosphoribosyltransferase